MKPSMMAQRLETAPPPVRQRLLLIDDDDLIREALQILLSEYYDVDAVACAEAGLERFEPGRFDLLITDLRLPGRQGDELAHLLHRVDPHLPALLITGDDLSSGDPRLDGFDGWLQKPFLDLEHVLREVALLLERSRLRRAG